MPFADFPITLQNKDLSNIPDSKVHGANMGPTWVLSAPDGLHVGPMNIGIGSTNTKIVLVSLNMSRNYDIARHCRASDFFRVQEICISDHKIKSNTIAWSK